jgi:hypothetical protein
MVGLLRSIVCYCGIAARNDRLVICRARDIRATLELEVHHCAAHSRRPATSQSREKEQTMAPASTVCVIVLEEPLTGGGPHDTQSSRVEERNTIWS